MSFYIFEYLRKPLPRSTYFTYWSVFNSLIQFYYKIINALVNSTCILECVQNSSKELVLK